MQLVTAGPLEPAARDAFEKQLQALLGADTTVAFAEDPALIAGAELHFPAYHPPPQLAGQPRGDRGGAEAPWWT